MLILDLAGLTGTDGLRLQPRLVQRREPVERWAHAYVYIWSLHCASPNGIYQLRIRAWSIYPVWISNCYGVYENLLPAPIVTLEQHGAEGVYVVPDLDEFVPLLGSNFTDYYASAKFDWKRLAGARVVEIEGQDPYAYAEGVAHAQSGNYLDHGVRVNSVFSSYRISGTDYSQRFGDLAGSAFPDKESLKMKVHVVNASRAETIKVPFLASYGGVAFTSGADL